MGLFSPSSAFALPQILGCRPVFPYSKAVLQKGGDRYWQRLSNCFSTKWMSRKTAKNQKCKCPLISIFQNLREQDYMEESQVFWHDQSGQPRCLKQKSYLLLHLRLHGERNCILWGNKTWISGSPPYFHPADKWLLLCPHLKMNKTSVLVWRHKNNKCCHLVIEGVGLSMCCKEEQALPVLKSVLSCSEVSQSFVVPEGWKCLAIYGQANLWIVFIQFMGIAEDLVWLQMLEP